MRVSTRIGFGLPSRSICRSSSTRSSLTWTSHRQVADLVEEDRRVVGQLEPADLPRQRAGERALLAAEQLAFDQRRRNRRAVDPHHGAPAPRAQLVNLRREQLLAGAGLAEQQHRRIGGRHLLHLLQDAANRGALADDVARAARGPGPRLAGRRSPPAVDRAAGRPPHGRCAGPRRSPGAPARCRTPSRRRAARAIRPPARRAPAETSMNPTAPTTRPATDSGTVTADRMPRAR